MEPLSAAKPLRSILNSLAERAVMLDKTHADLERASTRAGLIARAQVAFLKLELGFLLREYEYWHGLSLRAGVQLGAEYRTHTRAGVVLLTVYQDSTRTRRH